MCTKLWHGQGRKKGYSYGLTGYTITNTYVKDSLINTDYIKHK